MRALQRKVFPGGDGPSTFEPEVTAAQPTAQTVGAPSDHRGDRHPRPARCAGRPAARLTSADEENTNATAPARTRLGALDVLEAAPRGAAPAATPALTPAPTASRRRHRPAPRPHRPPRRSRRPDRAAPRRGAGDRQAARPAMPGERRVHLRLPPVGGGVLPEAQQQLTLFVEKYPSHAQISYGRNLLGRAYLDDGKAARSRALVPQELPDRQAGARARPTACSISPNR